MMFGSLSDTAMSSMRPPMLAGPTDRNRKLCSRGSADWLIWDSGAAWGAAPACASGRPDSTGSASAASASATTLARRKRLTVNVIVSRGFSSWACEVKAYTPANEDYPAAYDARNVPAYDRRGVLSRSGEGPIRRGYAQWRCAARARAIRPGAEGI